MNSQQDSNSHVPIIIKYLLSKHTRRWRSSSSHSATLAINVQLVRLDKQTKLGPTVEVSLSIDASIVLTYWDIVRR